jgi:copper homeostasis protein
MEREMDALGEAGADGFVFGILLADGSVDQPRMEALRQRAPNHPVMCHRAFDVTPDPLLALDALVDAGIDRVLSSGQRREIVAGLPKLLEIMAYANGRIEVQPCEGIRPENVTQVIDTLSPNCIHLGPFESVTDPTSNLGSEVHYGPHMSVDETCVREVVRLARKGSNQVFS